VVLVAGTGSPQYPLLKRKSGCFGSPSAQKLIETTAYAPKQTSWPFQAIHFYVILIKNRSFTVIQISESAAQKIKNLRQEEGRDTSYFLRVEVKKGGCSGLSYKMDFDNQIKTSDKQFDSFGEKVVVDSQSFLYLIGMTLEYSGGLNGKGFVFNNPNATKSCGCGSSFNV
jgi:iron-sulfur cluster assembly protein